MSATDANFHTISALPKKDLHGVSDLITLTKNLNEKLIIKIRFYCLTFPEQDLWIIPTLTCQVTCHVMTPHSFGIFAWGF